MLMLTWSICGDPLIDCTRDLYAAQQMANGRTLYHDLVYLFGPLAPCVLVVVFKMFGVSLAVAKTFNLILLTLFVAVVYRLLVRIADQLSATIACAIFITTCAFAQLSPLRNYNFLTPYTNSATYGFEAGVFSVALICRYARDRRVIWLALAGGLTGLTFFTKPEIFAASLATLCIGVMVSIWAHRLRAGKAILAIAWGAIGFLIAPMLLLIVLGASSGWSDAWSGATAGYRMAADPRLHSMRFELENMGFWRWRTNTKSMLEWACAYGWVLLPAMLVSLVLRGRSARYRVLALVLMAATASILIEFQAKLEWNEVLIGLPVVILVILIVLLWQIVRGRREEADISLNLSRFIFAVFSLMTLDRMILNTRIYHYGFVSAACAMMLITIALVGWLPSILDRAGRCGDITRGVAIGMLIPIIWVYGSITFAVSTSQDLKIQAGFQGNGQTGEILIAALNDLAARAKPGDTLAALPEACGINFMTNIPNPTPYELLDPIGMIRAGGEEPVLHAYMSSPPTWIVLVHHDTGVLGFKYFGRDFAKNLLSWINANYEQVALFGAQPLEKNAFGIAVMKHRVVSADVASGQ
ncbi:MAG TPA: hypothetical protein VHD56_10890 [Tepidisphaeraceae bacterium]|nr:hypothetical protein [Tepidisphaeraceae bacterium]